MKFSNNCTQESKENSLLLYGQINLCSSSNGYCDDKMNEIIAPMVSPDYFAVVTLVAKGRSHLNVNVTRA
jgi:hypothetical protein